MAKKSNQKNCWPNKFVWQENPYPHLKAGADFFFSRRKYRKSKGKINYLIVFFICFIILVCAEIKFVRFCLCLNFGQLSNRHSRKTLQPYVSGWPFLWEWRRSVSFIRINSYGIETAIRCFSLLYNFNAKWYFLNKRAAKPEKNVRAASAADGIKNDVWRMVGLVKTA